MQHHARLAAVLLAAFPAAATATPAHLSVRTGTLTLHTFDVSADAPWYPRKLDGQGRWVFDPGLVISYDHPTGWPIPVDIRFTLAAYSDCAAQPAGYLGVFPVLGEWRSEHVSFAGGAGFGVAVRRSWKRHVWAEHESDTFSDWGEVEGAVGPYGELELRLHPADRRWEAVVNLVPGIPYLLLGSVGVRFPLGD